MNLKEENEELKEVLETARSHIVELCTVMNIPLPDATIRRIDSALYQQDGNEVASPAQDERELPHYLNDAIDNLVHDNYERSQAGSRNRQADAELIRAALAARPAQKVNNVDTPEQQPVEIGEVRIRLENGHQQFEFEEYEAAYALPDGAHYLYAAPIEQTEQQPVAWQHKKPTVNDSGEIVGYSAWTNGKGLDWWPHRPLYATPHKG